MADDVIYGAIQDYVTANWSSYPIAWENAPFQRPPNAGPWILFEITGSMYDQQSIGASTQAANRYDQAGVMFFHVHVKKGTGSKAARQVGKQMADLFRGTLLIDENLEFMGMTIGEGNPADETGTYWRITVSIDWYFTDSG